MLLRSKKYNEHFCKTYCHHNIRIFLQSGNGICGS